MAGRVARLELKDKLYRQRYLVPNAVTVGNLFCGFLAIIYASSDRFEKAIIAIILAMALDGVDGRVARRLNATSKFGVEFDSFADLISFGLAPAMLMYHWCFRTMADEFGVFICFVYALCAAARLVRFNISEENLGGFEGLASPAAAGLVTAVVNVSPKVHPSETMIVLGTLLMSATAYLMVCKIPYMSVKKMKVSNLRLTTVIVLGALIALTWYMPRIGFVVLVLAYAASGPLSYLYRRFKSHRARRLRSSNRLAS